MAIRAMNNTEKANAAILKNLGFTVFYQYSGIKGDYWATHPKLVYQYHLRTSAINAVNDLSKKIKNQLTLF